MRLPGLDASREYWSAVVAVIAVAVMGILGPVLMIFATRSIAAVLLVGFALSGIAFALGVRGLPKWRVVAPGLPSAMIALALFVSWSALSLIWAADRTAALDVMAQLALVAIFAMVGLFALPRIAPRQAVVMQAIGLCLTTFIVLLDFALDFPIRRGLSGPDAAALPGSQLNRAMVVLCVLLWPTAAGFFAGSQRGLAAMLVALVTTGIFIADSQAAQLGIIAGLVMLALAWRHPVAMSRWLAGSVVLVILAMPLVVQQLQAVLPADLLKLLSDANALHRLEIWQAYAALVPGHWIAGLGLNASDTLSAVQELSGMSPAMLDGLANRHPHNMPLQIWVELGLVGALLAALALALICLRAGKADRVWAPWALAAIACCFAIGCVGHGAWQTWWMALLMAAYAWFEIVASRRDGALRQPHP